MSSAPHATPSTPLLDSHASDRGINRGVSTKGAVLGANWKEPRALVAQAGLLLFAAPMATILYKNPAGIFTYHPSFQLAAIILFIEGILLLQPTKTAPAKKTGLSLHRIFQHVGFLFILGGAAAIIYNKFAHNAKHFQSVHGKLGLATVVLLWTQVAAGELISRPLFANLLGGVEKTKKLWKFHRMSGYLVLVLLVATPLSTLSTDWVMQHSSKGERVSIGLGLVLMGLGVAARINLSKLGLRR